MVSARRTVCKRGRLGVDGRAGGGRRALDAGKIASSVIPRRGGRGDFGCGRLGRRTPQRQDASALYQSYFTGTRSLGGVLLGEFYALAFS
jgi:hypothetical protein